MVGLGVTHCDIPIFLDLKFSNLDSILVKSKLGVIPR